MVRCVSVRVGRDVFYPCGAAGRAAEEAAGGDTDWDSPGDECDVYERSVTAPDACTWVAAAVANWKLGGGELLAGDLRNFHS